MSMTPLFSFSGKVFRHTGRGKDLGYPTANIHIDPDTPEGIYVGYARITDNSYPALVFVGRPLTFGETDKKAEVYILDFDQNIYEINVDVSVLKKLRENIKFDSQEALIFQMQQDEKNARRYFNELKELR